MHYSAYVLDKPAYFYNLESVQVQDVFSEFSESVKSDLQKFLLKFSSFFFVTERLCV